MSKPQLQDVPVPDLKPRCESAANACERMQVACDP